MCFLQIFYFAELYPINIDIESADSISQVKEMHQFAFMGWWSNTSKLLRNMTGFKGNEENVWRGIIARNLAVAKLNVDGSSSSAISAGLMISMHLSTSFHIV